MICFKIQKQIFIYYYVGGGRVNTIYRKRLRRFQNHSCNNELWQSICSKFRNPFPSSLFPVPTS